MRLPLDQSLGLELVDDAHERDRLDLQQLGQTALMDTFVLREVSQDLPLRPRQARAPGVLLEASLQQARDLVQQKSKRSRIERWRVKRGRFQFHAVPFISKLIISLACHIARGHATFHAFGLARCFEDTVGYEVRRSRTKRPVFARETTES